MINNIIIVSIGSSAIVVCYIYTTVGPNAMDVSVSPLYFVADTSITLMAFTNIEGNPEPSSTWTVNSTAINSTADVRFNTSVLGQLSITDISSADAGTYTCTLNNGDVTFDMSATIELCLAGMHVMKCKK